MDYHTLEVDEIEMMETAEEAYQCWIVTFIVPNASVQEHAEALALRLAAGPTLAFGATKQLLHLGWNESQETQMMNESHTISSMGGSADSQEGISTFLAKRAPRFNGR